MRVRAYGGLASGSGGVRAGAGTVYLFDSRTFAPLLLVSNGAGARTAGTGVTRLPAQAYAQLRVEGGAHALVTPAASPADALAGERFQAAQLTVRGGAWLDFGASGSVVLGAEVRALRCLFGLFKSAKMSLKSNYLSFFLSFFCLLSFFCIR